MLCWLRCKQQPWHYQRVVVREGGLPALSRVRYGSGGYSTVVGGYGGGGGRWGAGEGAWHERCDWGGRSGWPPPAHLWANLSSCGLDFLHST